MVPHFTLELLLFFLNSPFWYKLRHLPLPARLQLPVCMFVGTVTPGNQTPLAEGSLWAMWTLNQSITEWRNLFYRTCLGYAWVFFYCHFIKSRLKTALHQNHPDIKTFLSLPQVSRAPPAPEHSNPEINTCEEGHLGRIKTTKHPEIWASQIILKGKVLFPHLGMQNPEEKTCEAPKAVCSVEWKGEEGAVAGIKSLESCSKNITILTSSQPQHLLKAHTRIQFRALALFASVPTQTQILRLVNTSEFTFPGSPVQLSIGGVESTALPPPLRFLFFTGSSEKASKANAAHLSPNTAQIWYEA